MIFNPMPNEVLDANDVLVMLGKVEDMKRMNEII
jgi:K+/H+ antiporter YhaU regulatory subunit KhtT